MEFNRTRDPDFDRDGMPPLEIAVLLLKVAAIMVFLAVGLKLTFWAVDVVDQLLHQPDAIGILRPLLEPAAGVERSFAIENTADAVIFRDHNAFSLFFLAILLAVLFGAIGRAIAALIGGAVRLIMSLDLKRRVPKSDR